jgi:hypothetical protein
MTTILVLLMIGHSNITVFGVYPLKLFKHRVYETVSLLSTMSMYVLGSEEKTD